MSAWGWISLVFSVAANIAVIAAVVKNKDVVPSVASWSVWWLVDALLCMSLFSAGASNAWPMFAAFTAGSTVVIALTIRKSAVVKFTKAEMAYVAIALVGVALWRFSADKNPAFSVGANILAAVMGTIPTISKSYLDPSSEDSFAWLLFFIGGALNVVAIPHLTFVEAAAPVTVATLQLMILLAIYFGSKRKPALARS